MQVCANMWTVLCHLLTVFQDHEETFQAYSTFTTNYKPPDEYESLLVHASKLRSRAAKAFDLREPLEISLVRKISTSAEDVILYCARPTPTTLLRDMRIVLLQRKRRKQPT